MSRVADSVFTVFGTIEAGVSATCRGFAIEVKLCGTFQDKKGFITGVFVRCMRCLLRADHTHFYRETIFPVSYTHLRAHETKANLVCRLLLEKKKKKKQR